MSASAWSALADRFAALAAEQEFQFNVYPFGSPATFHDDEGRFRLAYPFGGTPSAPESHVSVIGTGERQLGEFARVNRFRWLSWAAGLLLRPGPVTPPELHWWRYVRDRNTGRQQPHTVEGSTALAEFVRASAESAQHLTTHGTLRTPVQAAGERTNNWPAIQAEFRVLRARFDSPRWHTARPRVYVAAFPDYGSYDWWGREQMRLAEALRPDHKPWASRGTVSGDPEEVDAFAGLANDAGTALPLQLTFAPQLFPSTNCFSNMNPGAVSAWLEFLFLTCPAAFTLGEDSPQPGSRVATLNSSPFAVSVMAIHRILAQPADGFVRQFRANVAHLNPWFAEEDRKAAAAAVGAAREGGVAVSEEGKPAVHWTSFPTRVERFGDLLSILETLHRDRNRMHFESFANETEESAYTVEADGGRCHFEPRPDRMPGVERLLDRLEREGHAELTPRWLREVRRRVAESLKIDPAAVDDVTLGRAADALDAADGPRAAVSPPDPPPAAPARPDRAAFDAACQLTLAALRGARTLPVHRRLCAGPDFQPTLGERCEAVGAQVRAARTAIQPLVTEFRALGSYAGDEMICGKLWASAHEAAVEAANDLLWRYHPVCGDPGRPPDERVYVALERDVEREHAAALVRFCPGQPAPAATATSDDRSASPESTEQAVATTPDGGEAANPPTGHLAATPPPRTPATPETAVAPPSGPFTLHDVRDLIRYRRAHADYLARLRTVKPGDLLGAAFGNSLGINPIHNLQVLLALQEPQRPRMTEDDAVTYPAYQWLVTAARAVYQRELDEETLRLLVGRVGIAAKRTVPDPMGLPLDEFDRLRRSIPGEDGPNPGPAAPTSGECESARNTAPVGVAADLGSITWNLSNIFTRTVDLAEALGGEHDRVSASGVPDRLTFQLRQELNPRRWPLRFRFEAGRDGQPLPGWLESVGFAPSLCGDTKRALESLALILCDVDGAIEAFPDEPGDGQSGGSGRRLAHARRRLGEARSLLAPTAAALWVVMSDQDRTRIAGHVRAKARRLFGWAEMPCEFPGGLQRYHDGGRSFDDGGPEQEYRLWRTRGIDPIPDDTPAAGAEPSCESVDESPKAVTPTDQQPPVELDVRAEDVLVQMLEMGATRRGAKTTWEAVVRGINRTHDPKDYQDTFRLLRQNKLYASNCGRTGGIWLTEKGRAEAERVRDLRAGGC